LSERRRILILAGGFAGLYNALELQKRLAKRGRQEPRVEVALVNRDNFHVFHPLLPEVLSGAIETVHILNPLRRLCLQVHLYRGEVENIDLGARTVTINRGSDAEPRVLPYDDLVLALGAATDFSRVPGMAYHAFPFKTLGDAFYLRNHVIDMLERADAADNPDERRSLLTFAVAGAGFAGVEAVAELNAFVREAATSYNHLPHREIQTILLSSSARILPELDTSLAAFATRKLREKGVDVRLGARVASVTPETVVLQSGERLPTRTLVSTVGNAPHPLLATLGLPTDRSGRVAVDRFLAVPGFPGLWAAGDCASVPDPRQPGTSCPPTAQHAVRQATCLAANILAAIDGHERVPFTFRGLGQLASLGGHSAVAEVLGVKFSGLPAWLLWRAVYLSKLPGYERRVRVWLDWMLDLTVKKDIVQLQVERTNAVVPAHFEPGQEIVRQNEVGRRFYIITSGTVEVVRTLPDGSETMLRTQSEGEYFGEMALLGEGRRTATVRCVTPVEVVVLDRPDFLTLTTHLRSLRESVAAMMAQRR
jgi:NADH dehydrogenase